MDNSNASCSCWWQFPFPTDKLAEAIKALQRITAPEYVASGLNDTARVAAVVEELCEKLIEEVDSNQWRDYPGCYYSGVFDEAHNLVERLEDLRDQFRRLVAAGRVFTMSDWAF